MVLGDKDQKGFFRYSTDGGASFNTPDTTNSFYYVNYVSGYQYGNFVPPSSYFLTLGSVLWVSTDAGRTWDVRDPTADNVVATYMWSEARGMRVHYGKVSETRITTDSGRFFLDRIGEWTDPTDAVFIQDSIKIWRVNRKSISRSWDRGVTWETFLPVDSTGKDIIYRYLLSSVDTNRLYLIGGLRNQSDVYVSTDIGESWREVIATGEGRIQRIAEQTADRLWLMVSRRSMFPQDDVFAARGGGRFSDTLYFSTNGGITWDKDLTFVGDTISELQFTSADRGYVVSTKDSTVRVWKYVAEPAAVDARLEAFDAASMYVHPNPASTLIKYYPRFGGECKVRLVDDFGRAVYEEDVSLQHMQPTKLALPDYLPNGLYFLELVRGDARASQRFVIQR